MKLIFCHVENFGKLHDYSVDFSDGTNIICKENGWGKSTFAAFIRAMFYGLEGERKRSIKDNERKRYKPWQGGIFGGQIVFELQGKKYQISRIFNDKEINDEFELRDLKTNLLSNDYSKKIGEEIFKINRESFMKTIFIGQSECETTATDDINAKIGDLSDHSNDLNNVDSANAKLTEIINRLNPSRATGSLSKRKNEITKYERLVQEGQAISDSMDVYYGYLQAEKESYHQLKTQMKEVAEEQTRISKLQAILTEKTEWERLKKTVSDKSDEVETIRHKFPKTVPELEEIKKKMLVCGNMDKASDRVLLYQMTNAEKEEFSLLTTAFTSDIPEVETIDNKIEEASRLRKLNQELSSEQMSVNEKARLEELKSYFGNDSENITSIVGKWNTRNNKKVALSSKQDALMALKKSADTQKQQTKKSPMLIIGMILALLGMIAMLALSPIIGIVVTLIGIALLAVGFNGNKKESEITDEVSSKVENLQKMIDEDSDFISKTDLEVSDYLKAHGKVFEEDAVSTILQEIMTEAVEYSSLTKKAQRLIDNKKFADIDGLKKGIVDFLSNYGILSSETRFVDDLYRLKSNVSRFLWLTDKKEKFQKTKIEYDTYNREIITFLEKYGYEPKQNLYDQLSDIKDIVDDYLNAVKMHDIAKSELLQFEKDYDISVLAQIQIDENLPSLETINQTILKLTQEMEDVHNIIIGYNKTLEDLQEKYNEWEENNIKLQELKEIQVEEQKKYDCVLLAKKKLALAKQAMTVKYAEPILKSFSKYYEMISGNMANNFHVDANTTVTVDDFGKQREINTLSFGYRDLISICLRIALVDAMYQDEVPILIMDDPFANLDDEKVKASKKFIEKVSEKYQIIYFTCSNSRK